MTLIRNDDHIITDWFRKETFSGRFLHFSSNHPIEHKRAMVFTLVDKAVLLADVGFHHKNLDIVTKFLIDNGYPKKFINFNIKKRLNKIYCSNNLNFNKINNSRFSGCISCPFIPNFYKKIKNNLNRFYIRTVPKISNTLNKCIIRGKDKPKREMTTNVVYKINCNDCDASYVGETKRQLRCRIKEHMNNIKKDGNYVINEHMTEHKHTFDFDNAEILDTENIWKKRLVSEMIHIKLQDNSINVKEDTQQLSQFYNNILYNLKTRKK